MTELSAKVGMHPEDLVYERNASTLANPVRGSISFPPTGESGYVLIDFAVPTGRDRFVVYAVGSDQHENSTYTWIFDGIEMPFSGATKPGGIYDPLIFPEPIRVQTSIRVFISNGNAKDYPNPGPLPEDQIAYEAVLIGRWV